MAIAALVLGILGLVLSFVPCLGMYALPLTVLAIILGGLGMKKVPGKGMAIAGLVCGVIGTLVAGWWLYAFLVVRQAAKDGTLDKEFDKQVKELQKDTEKELHKDLKDTQPAPAEPAGSAATP